MTVQVTSLGAGVIRTTSDQSARLSAALSGRALGKVSAGLGLGAPPVRESAAAVTEDVNFPSEQIINLRSQFLDAASVGSTFEAIDAGGLQVSRLLGQLQSLASRASLALTDSELNLLNGQFQALRISINNVPPQPPGSTYSPNTLIAALPPQVQSVVRDVLAANNLDADTVLGGFNDVALLGDPSLASLENPEAAARTVSLLQEADQRIGAQLELLQLVRTAIDFVSAGTETALQNQQAQSVTLQDSDLDAVGVNGNLPALLQTQQEAARAAQTSRLPSNILQLLA